MRAIQLLLTTLLIIAVAKSQKQYFNSNENICRLLKDGTKLRKPGTCDTPITCRNFRSQDGAVCQGTTPFVDRNGKCVKTNTDPYCYPPCTAKSPKYVKDKKNCNGWYQCFGENEINRGVCGYNFYFDATTQQCNYPELVKCDPTYNLCDVIGNNVPIKDEANCHKYYTCKRSALTGKISLNSVTCNNQYYNVETGKCEMKAKVDCTKHPIPSEVCGTSKLAIRNRFVVDQATCRGYFYCKDLGQGKPDTKPSWGQCPVNEFFEPVQKACMKRSHVKCEEDRCDGRADGFELSPTRGCQHYLVCGQNYTIKEEQCANGLYFDADLRKCTTLRKSYPICE